MPEQEPGFSVDGRIYPVPAIDTFTFDELETLHRYCGLTINDWGRRYTPDGAKVWEAGTNHPGFQMSLVHIAYRRGNADVPNDTVSELVRSLVWLDVVEPLLVTEDEPAPLSESTSEPEKPSGSSPKSSPGSTEDERKPSGTSSPTGSETDADQDAPIGTSGSDTSVTPAQLKRVV